jgi:RHS repeat-associated protein
MKFSSLTKTFLSSFMAVMVLGLSHSSYAAGPILNEQDAINDATKKVNCGNPATVSCLPKSCTESGEPIWTGGIPPGKLKDTVKTQDELTAFINQCHLAGGIISNTGSRILNDTYNHVHTVTEWNSKGSLSSCASCSGGASMGSDMPVLGLTRTHGYRFVLEQASLGIGSFLSIDKSLRIFKVNGETRIDFFSPEDLVRHRFFLENGIFADTFIRGTKGIALSRADGSATTTMDDAARAILTAKDGRRYIFEIFTVDSASKAGRILRIEDACGLGLSFQYAVTPDAIAPAIDKWMLSTQTDDQGSAMHFAYLPETRQGRRVVSQVTLPNGQLISYNYASGSDGKLASVAYPDGRQANFIWSIASNGNTCLNYDEANGSGFDRAKTVYLTSNFASQNNPEGVEIYVQGGQLTNAIVKGGEVTYASYQENSGAWRKIYEGGGRFKRVDIGGSVRHVKNPQIVDLSQGANGITGTDDTPMGTDWANYVANRENRPMNMNTFEGNCNTYEYDTVGRIAKIKFLDGSTETFLWSADSRLLRKKSRNGLVQRWTYNAQGLVLTYSKGLKEFCHTSHPDAGSQAPGLRLKQYSGSSWSTLPDFDSLQPFSSGISSNVSLAPRIKTDYFGLSFQGKIKINTSGDYSFFLNSDDGSKLWIDGVLVIDNDGAHGAIEKSATVNLSGGLHDIRVDYSEINGAEALTLKFQGADSANLKTYIPDAAFSHSILASDVAVCDIECPESFATFTYEYNEFGLKTREIDALGNLAHRYTYDANKRLLQVITANDSGTDEIVAQTYTYTPEGLVSTITDANARTTSFSWDAMGRKMKTTYYDGSTELDFRDSKGEIVKTKDRIGATTLITRDAAGRVSQTIRGYSIMDSEGNNEVIQPLAAQSVESSEYLNGTTSLVARVSNGERTEYTLDYIGRTIATKTFVDATKSLVSTSTYLNNKLFSTTDTYGRKSYNLYRGCDNAQVRIVQELVPGAVGQLVAYAQVAAILRDTNPNPAYLITDSELDAAGLITAIIDPKGVRSEITYDIQGRNIRSVQAVAFDPLYHRAVNFTDVDASRTAVTLAGGWISNDYSRAALKQLDLSVPGQITFWAVLRDGSHTKGIKIQLSAAADGSIAQQVLAAKYTSENNLDFNFETGGTSAPIASSLTAGGYGLGTLACYSSVSTASPTGIAVTSERDYDLNGNVTEVRHPRYFSEGIAAKTRYTYSARGKQLSTIAADNSVTSQTYHDDGRLATSTDALGNTSTSLWPTCCNNSSVTTDPTDVAEITNNDAAGRTTHQIVKRDASTCGCSPNNPASHLTMRETTRRYDARGRVVASTVWLQPLGYVDSNNAPIADDPALGLTTRYVYYDSVIGVSELLPTLAKLPSGTFASGLADGSAILVINPEGERSLVINDGVDRSLIHAKLGHDNEPITWSTATHDVMVNGLLEFSQTDALGNTNKSRSRISIDAAGNQSTASFDANGNRVESRDALGHGQNCSYDALNRRITCADTQALAEVKARLTTYNASGAILTQTDTKGVVTTNSYDLLDRLVSITERNTGILSFAYNAKGQRISVTDQLGKVTAYSFNPRGELIKTINADASVDETVFDALGRKIKVIHPGGNSVVMAYDLASRLLSRSYFAAGSGIAESVDTFTYDKASRPLTANNADAQITYAYDAIGRRIFLTQTVDGLAKTVNFVYDAANRLLSRSVEGLAVESRSLTNRGQLAQVKLDNSVVADFSYDQVGRETSRTYGNGLNTTSSYSRADNLITSITVANKPELSFGYSYDSNKNVTAEQRGGSMALYSWNATFDAMDRLNSQNDGAQTRNWSLDLVGNTTAETLSGTAEARTLNDMHAPTAAGNQAYTYDSNGQMTAKPGYTLVWDARNHLVLSTGLAGILPGPVAPVAYRYDAFGNRVSKGSTRYLLVDNQVLAEFTGSTSKQYCYGSYIDEVLAEKGSAVAYYHRNRQYNTSALTDSSGSVLEMYSTDAMGRVKAFDAAATAKAAPTATTVLFTGRVFDVETGLYYFRARYFDSELGVFISRDPLGFVDGQSVYQGWFGIRCQYDAEGTSIPRTLTGKPEIIDVLSPLADKRLEELEKLHGKGFFPQTSGGVTAWNAVVSMTGTIVSPCCCNIKIDSFKMHYFMYLKKTIYADLNVHIEQHEKFHLLYGDVMTSAISKAFSPSHKCCGTTPVTAQICAEKAKAIQEKINGVINGIIYKSDPTHDMVEGELSISGGTFDDFDPYKVEKFLNRIEEMAKGVKDWDCNGVFFAMPK